MKKALEDCAKRIVKPHVKSFMLAVWQNIDHDINVLNYIKSIECSNKKYKSQIIEIDSKKGTVEKDENIQLL